MDSSREDRIYELQQALLDLDPAQWASFLDEACHDDASLRDEVIRRQRESTRDVGVHTPPPVIRLPTAQDLLSTTDVQATNRRRGPRLRKEQVFGSYRIVRLLGRGGMGEVYEADDVDSGRRVALKVLHIGFASDRDRQRFLREVAMIRFGGHLPRGGYDVQHGRPETETGPAQLHRRVQGRRGAPGRRRGQIGGRRRP